MNIDKTCNDLLELTENSFALTGLCEAGFDWQELIELARQRNELLKAAKDAYKAKPITNRLLKTVIQSCE